MADGAAKPERAVVACTQGGAGVVLWSFGGGIEALMDGTGPVLQDLGLDDAPPGISIWEGVVGGGEWSPGIEDYADIYPEGTFRAPTDEEWVAIRAGRSPWEHLEQERLERDLDAEGLLEPEASDG